MAKIRRHTIGTILVFLGAFLLKDIIEDMLSLFISVQVQVVLGIVLLVIGSKELNKI